MRKRSYRQLCGVAKALDVVGSRWTLLIIRNLLLGPQRYTDLLRGLPGITTNLLADRLRELEDDGLVERVELAAPAGGDAYDLTPRGGELEPVVHALGRWGWDLLSRPARTDVSDPAWAMLALKRRYAGVSQPLRVHLRVDDRSFAIACGPGGVEIRRGEALEPDVELAGPFDQIRGLLFQGVRAARLIKSGAIRVDGSRQMLLRFLRAFDLR